MPSSVLMRYFTILFSSSPTVGKSRSKLIRGAVACPLRFSIQLTFTLLFEKFPLGLRSDKDTEFTV